MSLPDQLRLRADKIASITRNFSLPREVSLRREAEAREGVIIAGRIRGEKSTYNQLEDVHGRMSTLHEGDIVIGALGQRHALHGYAGRVPQTVNAGDRLHMLNLGGVIGECTTQNPSAGPPFEVEVLGQLLVYEGFESRRGTPASLALRALPDSEAELECPVVVVSGACMNSGKTAAAGVMVRALAQSGLRVGGAKLTGVSLLRDTLHMKDYGAACAFDFTDAGFPSTVAATAPIAARRIAARLAQERLDVVVAEMGDGILGAYGVQEILADNGFMRHCSVFVYCASDPVGAWGGARLLSEQYGITPALIAGPVTDNRVGSDYIERELGIRALNARNQAAELGQYVLSRLQAAGEQG